MCGVSVLVCVDCDVCTVYNIAHTEDVFVWCIQVHGGVGMYVVGISV